MNLLPKLTFSSVFDYVLFGSGIVLGYALFGASMTTIEENLKKNGGV